MRAGHKNAVLELHWTSDGERLLSASPDKSVRAWDAATGEQVRREPLGLHWGACLHGEACA
jgi:Prp8 binding protein